MLKRRTKPARQMTAPERTEFLKKHATPNWSKRKGKWAGLRYSEKVFAVDETPALRIGLRNGEVYYLADGGKVFKETIERAQKSYPVVDTASGKQSRVIEVSERERKEFLENW